MESEKDNNQIHIRLGDRSEVHCAPQTRVCDIVDKTSGPGGLYYVGALVNNDAVSLSYPLEVDSEVILLTMADHHGWRIYRRSVCFLLAKTVVELYPEARFSHQLPFCLGEYRASPFRYLVA